MSPDVQRPAGHRVAPLRRVVTVPADLALVDFRSSRLSCPPSVSAPTDETREAAPPIRSMPR